MPNWLEIWQTFALVITIFFMVIGLFGLIIPIFPGLVVIWVAALIYGLLTGLSTLGWVMFAIMTVLMVIGNLADNVMMGKKARDTGAAWSSIILGLLAGLIVSLFLTPIAGIFAAPLALFGAEFYRVRDSEKAFQSTKAMMIGLGWAFVIRFGIGTIMILLWAIGVWG